MSTEKNKALVHRFFEEVFNKGNLAVVDDLFDAARYVNHTAPPGMPSTLDGSKMFFTAMRVAFPDLRVSLDQIVAEGDKVADRGVFRGTHQGEFLGIPPTDKPVEVTFIDIFRIVDGKFVEHWDSFDQLGLLQQLGVVPVPGQG